MKKIILFTGVFILIYLIFIWVVHRVMEAEEKKGHGYHHKHTDGVVCTCPHCMHS